MVSNSPKQHFHSVDLSPEQINNNKEVEDIRSSQKGTVYLQYCRIFCFISVIIQKDVWKDSLFPPPIFW